LKDKAEERATPKERRVEPSRKVGYVGLLVAIGLVLQIVESSLPPLLPIPGARLGLANLATVIALFFLGPAEALEVTVLRTLLGGLLRGSIVGMALGMSGGLAAWAVMAALYLFYPTPFSITGVSVAGAAAHNTAQLWMAVLLVDFSGLWYYLPYLLLVAVPTGLFIGVVARRLGQALVRYTDEGYVEIG
jgi:heptaprenyl diphosphate synthase